MITAPAVDLRGGRCVQLVGGIPEEERVSLPDPVSVAAGWRERGFDVLHVVDLDAALGTGDNREIVRRILDAGEARVQVGGGIRDDDAADALLDAGAARVVVGTRAVDDAEWLRRLAGRHPGRIMVAADVRDGRVLRRGWTEEAGVALLAFLRRLAPLPLAGVLCTDVGREGRVEGIDRDQARRAVEGSGQPVWIAGGISSLGELRELAGMGAAGAVLGMALYTEAVDPETVAAEFGGGR